MKIKTSYCFIQVKMPKLPLSGDNKEVQHYKVKNANAIGQLIETPHGIFGILAKCHL